MIDLNSMTPQQLRDLAEKKEVAHREEQQKLKEAENKKRREDEAKKRTEQATKIFQAHIDALTAALKTIAPKREINGGIEQWGSSATVTVKGSGYVFRTTEFKQVTNNWNPTTCSGRLFASVGEYGERQRYPQRKDGTFNYDVIAERMVRDVEIEEQRNKERAERQTTEAKSGKLAAQVRKDLNVPRFGQVKITESSRDAEKVRLCVEFYSDVTPGQSKEWIAALRLLGVKIEGDKE